MNTVEALIIVAARLEDILQDDDGQTWKEAAKALSQLQQAIANAAPAVPQGWAFSVSDDDDGTWLRVKSPVGREAAFSAVNGGLAHDNRRSIASHILLELKDALAAPSQEPVTLTLAEHISLLEEVASSLEDYKNDAPWGSWDRERLERLYAIIAALREKDGK